MRPDSDEARAAGNAAMGPFRVGAPRVTEPPTPRASIDVTVSTFVGPWLATVVGAVAGLTIVLLHRGALLALPVVVPLVTAAVAVATSFPFGERTIAVDTEDIIGFVRLDSRTTVVMARRGNKALFGVVPTSLKVLSDPSLREREDAGELAISRHDSVEDSVGTIALHGCLLLVCVTAIGGARVVEPGFFFALNAAALVVSDTLSRLVFRRPPPVRMDASGIDGMQWRDVQHVEDRGATIALSLQDGTLRTYRALGRDDLAFRALKVALQRRLTKRHLTEFAENAKTEVDTPRW